MACHGGLQIVSAAMPSAAKAGVCSGPLLQGWPASHPAMHLPPPPPHHTYHNKASLHTLLYLRETK